MTQAPSAKDHLAAFASIIGNYEHRVGHACRAVAGHIPALLTGLPATPIILDNACGTGAATEEILNVLPSARVYAADAVSPMVEAMKAIVATKPKLQKNVVEVKVMNGQELRYKNGFFDVSITNFGIFFFPDPALGAREVYRTLKPGGTAVFTLWKEFGFKPVLWEVQRRVKPANPLTELPLMEPWCDPALLRQTLHKGGFTSVQMTSVKVGMWGTGRKDLESVLLENFQAMVAKNWTDKEKSRLAAVTAQTLDDNEARFCIKSGGKVGVPMTAWVAVARK
jgi:ubiquinone/menaquinone biosynthesis C-methylase UbiE